MKQTVDRTDSVTASGTTCLPPTDNAPRAENVVPAALSVLPGNDLLNEFVLPLLPVHSARELLIGLATNWRIWSGADLAVIAVRFTEFGKTLIARASVAELPSISESRFDASLAVASFPDFLKADAVAPCEGIPNAALPFAIASQAVGGALLYPSHAAPQCPGDVERLCLWSGHLIDQSIFVERGTANRQAIEVGKVAALAEFAAGAGHEINNPLATIAGRVQMLLRDEEDANHRQGLATIAAQALRVRDMIGDLILFAQPPAPVPTRLLLNEVARTIVERFADRARSRSCVIAIRSAATVFATADPTQLQVVLSELVRNSLDAAECSGQVGIGLARSVISGTGYAVLSVTDNGPGLSEKDRAHLFDPFYSGRDAGRGLGFGLCKCWRIVSNHGGWIEVESVARVATTFRVFWPDEPPVRLQGSV